MKYGDPEKGWPEPPEDWEPPKECPYCAPDGTLWNGDGSKICPHCKGSHYINETMSYPTDLPSSPASLLRLTPSTNDEINRFANILIQSVQAGEENPIAILIQVRAMEKAFKIITEKIQRNLLTEADKHPENKFEYAGNFIEKSEFVRYDYAVSGDKEWELFSVAEQTAANARKEREGFLRTLKKEMDILDKETGEIITIRPPLRKSVSGLKVFIK